MKEIRMFPQYLGWLFITALSGIVVLVWLAFWILNSRKSVGMPPSSAEDEDIQPPRILVLNETILDQLKNSNYRFPGTRSRVFDEAVARGIKEYNDGNRNIRLPTTEEQRIWDAYFADCIALELSQTPRS